MTTRLVVSTGTAVLAVCAVGFQANGSVLDSGVSAGGFGGPGSNGAAATSAIDEPVSNAGAVSARSDVLLSYSRTMVLTGTTEQTGKLNAASAQLRRPGPGTLMAPLDALTPSSPYGLRTNPITGSAGEFHWGLDFSAPCGTRVHAADAGVVRAVGWHQWGGGNRVELDHGNGLVTTYNHLEGAGVVKGQSLQAGDLIAKVGTTGASTGCHLHFETILNGSHTDPGKWTLQPLRQLGRVADLRMTDYRVAGTSTDAPDWAVPAAQRHIHDVADGGHDSTENMATPAPSSPPSAPIAVPRSSAAPAPSDSPSPAVPTASAPASAPSLAPAPSLEPFSKVTQEPLRSPEPEPTAEASATQTAAPSAP